MAADVDRPRAGPFPQRAAVTLDELDATPHAVHHRLRDDEPVSWLPCLDGWLITAHGPALEAMRDADAFTVDDPRFSTAQVIGPSMLSLDGEIHARHRVPFVAPFRAAAVSDRPGRGDRRVTASRARGGGDRPLRHARRPPRRRGHPPRRARTDLARGRQPRSGGLPRPRSL